MPAPKKRTTKSKRDKRRQHIFIKKPALGKCPKCGKSIIHHTVCPFCGHYAGREVIDVMAKLNKKEKKKREKDIKEKEREDKGISPKKRSLDWRSLSRK